MSGDGPLYDQAILGGLGNLSGYAYGQLVGEAASVIGLNYRNRVTRIPGLSEGVYAGVLLEAGNVYPSLSDVQFDDMKTSSTFYIGMDTSYGPLMGAVSKAPHEDVQWYIQIGRSF